MSCCAMRWWRVLNLFRLNTLMSDSVHEIRALTDAMFDGVITAEQTLRLDSLIVHDAACLQAYLEILNLHGDLLARADAQTDEQAAITALQDFSNVCEIRERRTQYWLLAASVASILLLLTGTSWMWIRHGMRPAPIGNIAHLTSNAAFSVARLDLGDVLHKGSSLDIEEGVVTIELPNVLIDLIGPASLQLNNAGQVRLLKGMLTAHVLPGGQGFKVRTPDAEVVDLGTEFSVKYDAQQGTDVSVRRGRARASLLDQTGAVSKIVDLTTSRSAKFVASKSILSETAFQPELFDQVHRARGAIRSISGQLRTPAELPASLQAEQAITPNHMLVIPEQQHVTLLEDLIVDTLTGRKTIPAGVILRSYLVHYDPTDTSQFAPRGAVTFFGKIAAVLNTTGPLNATDSQFGLPDVLFDNHSFRGLEMDFDQIHVSDDNQTVSFFFGMAPPTYLDQVRILVFSTP